MRDSLSRTIDYIGILLITTTAILFASYGNLPGEMAYVGLQTEGMGFDLYYINSILHSYRYSSDYKQNVFDCSQMSILLHDFMEEHNFSSKIALVRVNNTTIWHNFVVVQKGNYTILIEPTGDPLNEIGRITKTHDGYMRLYEPEEIKELSLFRDSEWETNETILPKYIFCQQ